MNFNEQQASKTHNDESDLPEPTHEAEVIALISGKGGVGKTAIAGSMASFIGQLGHKVLLVDADIATHGMSYFFIDQVQKATKSGALIPLVGAIGPLESRFVDIADNFDFVPSKVEFQQGERQLRTTEEIAQNQETASRVLTQVIDEAQSLYDFIIVDCQAGAVASTYEIIKRADRLVSVLEADPVGVWASRSLDRAFGDAFPEFTFYLVNKLFSEEVSQYDSLTNYLRIFAHLPPLPFDFEVRRAFARRVLPTDSQKPSAFTFGLIRTLRDLLPTLEIPLDNFEHELRGKILGPVQEQVEELDSRILDLSAEISQFKRKRSRRRRFYYLGFLAMFMLSSVIVAWVTDRLSYPEVSQTAIILASLFALLGMMASVATLFSTSLDEVVDLIGKLLWPSEPPEKTRESLDLELEKLREERKALVTYMATMSKDLILRDNNLPGAEEIPQQSITT
jgi:cellulose biosynthesis protein BcsQ/archaellum component FlaC